MGTGRASVARPFGSGQTDHFAILLSPGRLASPLSRTTLKTDVDDDDVEVRSKTRSKGNDGGSGRRTRANGTFDDEDRSRARPARALRGGVGEGTGGSLLGDVGEGPPLPGAGAKAGGPPGDRTRDTLIKSQVLYH